MAQNWYLEIRIGKRILHQHWLAFGPGLGIRVRVWICIALHLALIGHWAVHWRSFYELHLLCSASFSWVVRNKIPHDSKQYLLFELLPVIMFLLIREAYQSRQKEYQHGLKRTSTSWNFVCHFSKSSVSYLYISSDFALLWGYGCIFRRCLFGYTEGIDPQNSDSVCQA